MVASAATLEGQLIAMRYGSVPIVRAVGGLADTVQEYDPRTCEGNGFTFANYDAWEFFAAIVRALELYRFTPEHRFGLPSRKVRLYQQDNGSMRTTVLGDDGVIGYGEVGPVKHIGALIQGSTELHVVVNPKLGYTTVAGLRFKDDCTVNIRRDGAVQVSQSGIHAADENGVAYVSQLVSLGNVKVTVMVKSRKK